MTKPARCAQGAAAEFRCSASHAVALRWVGRATLLGPHPGLSEANSRIRVTQRFEVLLKGVEPSGDAISFLSHGSKLPTQVLQLREGHSSSHPEPSLAISPVGVPRTIRSATARVNWTMVEESST